MFQLKYPIFTKGRLLRIEKLDALRDLSLHFIQTNYAGFSDGILQGFDVETKQDQIIVHPGLVKCHDQILIHNETITIPYQATDEWVVLKISIESSHQDEDLFIQKANLNFGLLHETKENEWEIMRFKLKQAAYLRTEYQNFNDLITEYNTVNPLYRKVALANGEKGISPPMLQLFADYLREFRPQEGLDQNICFQILQNHGVLSTKALAFYISVRLGEDMSEQPEGIHQQLNRILMEIQRNKVNKGNRSLNNRKLIVD